MTIVYIAHPISGDIQGNLQRIKEIARHITLKYSDVVAFAPYWFDCHFLDDTILAERGRGIKNDVEFFNRGVIDEVWLCGPRISNGMKHEKELAEILGIPVINKIGFTIENI